MQLLLIRVHRISPEFEIGFSAEEASGCLDTETQADTRKSTFVKTNDYTCY